MINGNKGKYSHVVVIFRLTQFLSVTSADKQQSFNCDQYLHVHAEAKARAVR